MRKQNKQSVIPDEIVMSKIYLIRNKKVMLDKDLAELYGVETRTLKQQVKRNIDRFPNDFMFQLSKDEYSNLRSQIVISSWGGPRYIPLAFTEQGVAMLSSVLNSKQAILVNIQIIRIFARIRELLATHKDILYKIEQLEKKDIEHEQKISIIFKYLKQLEKSRQEEINFKSRKKIGYK